MYFKKPSSEQATINIFFKDNNGGLSHDARLLTNILKSAGFLIFHNGKPINHNKKFKLKNYCIKSIRSLIGLKPYSEKKKCTLSIHLESIAKYNLRSANKNIFIPNLEWLREATYDLLSEIDLFICKTRSSFEFFNERSLPAVYTSFSSIRPNSDRYKQKPNTFIHIAGNSTEKGTLALLQLWSKHPKWPILTVVTRDADYVHKFKTNNINLINRFLEQSKLEQLQNESEVHLCPSEAEGFGHYICEPLSLGAIVVTVDGFPMNELVQPERGFLVHSIHQERLRYAKKFTFDPKDLEKKIEFILKMSPNEKEKMKKNAIEWFNRNHSFFHNKFLSTIEIFICK
ncbi:Glycosyltransferase involved in cell wall bisynthesis [Cycloclasticus pugetii]|jgi:hypothetical protein|nr:Glycosyltransferase involved in cell wall bisynthesis [Cycloclasticus pugetii]